MADTRDPDEQDEYVCKCGEVFETLDALKAHAEEHHPDLYREKFA